MSARRPILPVLSVLSVLMVAALAAVAAPSLLAEPKSPSTTQLAAFRTKAGYTPKPFEMELGPEVRLGKDTLINTLAFPSPVTSVAPDPNDTVRGRYIRRKDAEPAAVICIGGWRRDPLTPGLAVKLAAKGVHVVYLQLPFQEQRTPEGQWPGALTFSADLEQNEATFLQIAQDIGRARDWLVKERKIDPERIGLMGTSLGGFAVATLYGMHADVRCAAVMLAGGQIADVVYNGNRLTYGIRQALEAKGMDKAAYAKRVSLIEPATWASPKRKDGLFLMAAENDSVVPLASVKALAAAYGGSRVHVMKNVGHIAPAAVQEHFPHVADHLAKILVPERVKREAEASKDTRNDDQSAEAETSEKAKNDGRDDGSADASK